MLKNLFSPKFEIGSYFLKSIKKFLYNWGNKTSQHSGSSLETLEPYHSNNIINDCRYSCMLYEG